MSNKLNKSEVASNMAWRFADKWGTQLITLVISTVIARILDPSDFGVIAIVNTFINIFAVFTDCGLSDSLIQKKDADDLDYSTAFFANIALCLVVYLALFICAPFIANFYAMDNLTTYIRFASLTIIISAYKNIQHAYVAKHFLFKKYFFASIIGTIGAGIIGIIMAIKGYSVWALIVSNLFDTLVDTLFCAFTIDWKPKLMFSFERLKTLFGFGSKMLLVNLFERIYNKMYQIIVGKVYSTEELAYFDKADNVSNKLTNNIDYTIDSVLFPTMSSVQNDKEELKKLTKRVLKLNTYVIYPLLFGLLAVSEPFIETIFTAKWLPAVSYLEIFCLIRLTLPINTINNGVIKAVGKSGQHLKQQTIIKIISIVILVVTVNMGTLQMTIGLLISSIIGNIIVMYPNKQIIDYGIKEQLLDILPSLLLSIIMCLTVKGIGFVIKTSPLILLIIEVLIGMTTYVLLSIVSKNESFKYLLEFIKERIWKK